MYCNLKLSLDSPNGIIDACIFFLLAKIVNTINKAKCFPVFFLNWRYGWDGTGFHFYPFCRS